MPWLERDGAPSRPAPSAPAGGTFRHDRISSRAATHEEILVSRDRRAAFQRELIAGFGLPVMSLTLVSPGPVKDSPGRRLLMDMAENALADEVRSAGLALRHHSRRDGIAGPEAMWVVEGTAERLKRLAVRVEDAHPWGRLLDIDVVQGGEPWGPVPQQRQTLGYELRRCLVCDAAAKECIGSRRHPPAAAEAVVAALIERVTGMP